LPPPPGPLQRDAGAAAGHPAQPLVLPEPDGRDALGDRRGNLRRLPRVLPRGPPQRLGAPPGRLRTAAVPRTGADAPAAPGRWPARRRGIIPGCFPPDWTRLHEPARPA